MLKRLKQIITHYNLSASSFADKIDVPRSSISHLLSGRNKASLDFVMKVVDSFEEVELNWLVYGTGSFPKNKLIKNTDNQPKKQPVSSPSLFDKVNEPQGNKEDENTTKTTQIEQKKSAEKTIKKVIVLYSDGTFSSYKNNE